MKMHSKFILLALVFTGCGKVEEIQSNRDGGAKDSGLGKDASTVDARQGAEAIFRLIYEPRLNRNIYVHQGCSPLWLDIFDSDGNGPLPIRNDCECPCGSDECFTCSPCEESWSVIPPNQIAEFNWNGLQYLQEVENGMICTHAEGLVPASYVAQFCYAQDEQGENVICEMIDFNYPSNEPVELRVNGTGVDDF